MASALFNQSGEMHKVLRARRYYQRYPWMKKIAEENNRYAAGEDPNMMVYFVQELTLATEFESDECRLKVLSLLQAEDFFGGDRPSIICYAKDASEAQIYSQANFRRIAQTPYFCYTQRDLWAYALPVPDPKGYLNTPIPPPPYPIHFAIAWADDDEELQRCIQDAYSSDPTTISRRDNYGMTPVFFTTVLHNTAAIRLLLELGGTADLFSMDGPDRLTPLRAAQSNFAERRSEEQRPIIELLQSAMVPLLPTADCTCGQCKDGWLSLRMANILSNAASLIQKHTFDCIFNFPAPSRAFVDVAHLPEIPYIKYFPEEAKSELFKTAYGGFDELMFHIQMLFRPPEALPIGDTCWPAHISRLIREEYRTGQYAPFNKTKFFLRKGGNVLCAFDCLAHVAETLSLEPTSGDVRSNLDLDSLPACANDHKYDLLRRKFALWGNFATQFYRCAYHSYSS